MHRRDMLAGVMPGLISAAGAAQTWGRRERAFPDRLLLAQDPEQWWTRFRADQFLLESHFAYLNNGTLGVPPMAVIETIVRGLTQSGQVGEGAINRWGAPIEETNARSFDDLRARLGSAFGCRSAELTLTHNTTEALAIVASALELSVGDEIVITDQEHPANVVCWTRVARDKGLKVVRATIPRSPRNESEVLDAFEKAISPRARLLSFPGVISSTGIKLPIERIVALAKAHSLVTVVDGAHLPGQIPLDLNAIGCDYLAASAHKWLFAPAGSGLLYARGDRMAELAARIRPEESLSNPAQMLMQTGTNNGAVFDGFAAALTFYDQLGPPTIFERLRQLRDYMMACVRKVPGAILYTPDDPAFSAGMVSFHIPGIEMRAFTAAFQAANIRVAPGNGIRLSAHVHTRKADIDRFFTVLSNALKGRVI